MELFRNTISYLILVLLFLLITNNIATAQEESTTLYGYVSKTDYAESEKEENNGRPPLPPAYEDSEQTHTLN